LMLICHFGEVESKKAKKVDKKGAGKYLARFGYFAKYTYSGQYEKKQEKKALKLFQEFANIKQTGVIDDATINQMNEPRCLNQDFKTPNKTWQTRVRRYNHQGSKWNRHPVKLSWRYDPSQETKDLSRAVVVKTLKKAMCLWSSQTNVEFVEDNSGETPDIVVAFGEGSHGDPFPFDGAGGVLAHAFYPLNNKGLAGDMHFDDAETYTVGTTVGRNLLWVATHELGHSLGLAHTSDNKAIMYPWYLGYIPNLALREDDRRGIQELYGGKIGGSTTCDDEEPAKTPQQPATTTTKDPTTTKVPTTTNGYTTTNAPITNILPVTPTNSVLPPPSCPTGITAIWEMPDEQRGIATHSGLIYIVSKNGRPIGLPRKRRDVYPSLPGDIDAAYTTTLKNKGKTLFTIFFTGNKYSVYKYTGEPFSGPHSLHSWGPLGHFPRLVKKVDAVMQWRRGPNYPTYFFFKDLGLYKKLGRVGSRQLRGTSKGWKIKSSNVNAVYSSKGIGTYFILDDDEMVKLDDSKVRPYKNQAKHGKKFIGCNREP